MELQITTITAGLLGLWYMVLTFRVLGARRSAGDSNDGVATVERRVRGHGNASEYIPIGLILLGLAEMGGFYPEVLWASAGGLVIGRLLHGYAFGFTDYHWFGRFFGTLLTLTAIITLSIANLWGYFSG